MSDMAVSNAANKELVTEHYIQIGDCCFDQTTRVLHSAVGETTLEPRIADLLTTLISAGTPVSRGDLLDAVWGDEGSDEALTQAISRLRRAMNDTARPYRIIATVPKSGYQVAVDVLKMNTLPVEFTANQKEAARATTWISRHREFLFGTGVGIAATLLVIAAWVITHPPVEINETIECYAGSTEAECQQAPSSLAE